MKGVTMIANIHSLESFGTVDGPGIRFVIFFKGCPLRCQYCHNPDTWSKEEHHLYTVTELLEEILKYKSYITPDGGVTATGGEPLLQMEFIIELFRCLKEEGIHTACDTSGITFAPKDIKNIQRHERLLEVTDLFLLDIKHIHNQKHKALTGVENTNILKFAKFLSDHNKKMWIRHVLIPGITANDEDLLELKAFLDTLKTVEKIEVLPYHTMGILKYQKLGMPYPLKGVKPPTKEEVIHAKILLGIEERKEKNNGCME